MTADDPTLLPGGASAGAPAAPPASERVLLARVVDVTVSVAECSALVTSRASGAVVTFEGVVRDHDGGRSVTELEYVGHPTAEAVIRELAEEFAARPEVHAVAVSHRIGLLGIGDIALACAVSTSHRGQAFDACRDLIDTLKADTPIWKHQSLGDGSTEWVGLP